MKCHTKTIVEARLDKYWIPCHRAGDLCSALGDKW